MLKNLENLGSENLEYVIQVQNFIQAKENIWQIYYSLKDSPQKLIQKITLINADGTIRSMGTLSINYIFQKLNQEFLIHKFLNKVLSSTFTMHFIMNVEEDLAGLITALQLGYNTDYNKSNIRYAGKSASALKLIKGQFLT